MLYATLLPVPHQNELPDPEPSCDHSSAVSAVSLWNDRTAVAGSNEFTIEAQDYIPFSELTNTTSHQGHLSVAPNLLCVQSSVRPASRAPASMWTSPSRSRSSCEQTVLSQCHSANWLSVSATRYTEIHVRDRGSEVRASFCCSRPH